MIIQDGIKNQNIL